MKPFDSHRRETHRRKVLAFGFFVFVLAWLGGQRAARPQSGVESAEILFSRSVLLYEEGKLPEAKDELIKAHGLDPSSASVLYYLGLTLHALRNYSGAADYLKKGLLLEPQNNDLRFQLGLAYVELEDYQAALRELQIVRDSQPAKENLGYFLGLCAFRQGDYPRALAHFEKNLSTQPEYQQLNRYYKGLALQALGRDSEAAVELAEADRMDPSSQIAGISRQLLARLEERQRRLRLEVTARVHYDSNLASRPTRSTPLVSAGLGSKSSWGNLVQLRGDYGLIRAPKWDANASYNFLQTLNYQNHRFDLQEHTLAGALAHKMGGGLSFGAEAGDSLLLVGGSRFLERPTATMNLTLEENKANTSSVFFRFQRKAFLQNRDLLGQPIVGDEDRDADNWMAGLGHEIRLAADRRKLVFVYQFDNENADGRNWSYSGHKAVFSFQSALPLEIHAGAVFELHNRWYDNRRRDLETSFLFTLDRKVRKDMSLTLESLWDNNHSSIPLYKTRRNLVSFGLTRRY